MKYNKFFNIKYFIYLIIFIIILYLLYIFYKKTSKESFNNYYNIENDNIKLEELKLKHDWPQLHNETSFNNYKNSGHYFPLRSIVNNNLTDKNSNHCYLDVYEEFDLIQYKRLYRDHQKELLLLLLLLQ